MKFQNTEKNVLFKDNTGPVRMIHEYLKKWRNFIEILTYPVSIIDTEYNVMAANTAMLDLYGKNELPDTAKCHDFFHKSSCPVNNCPVARYFQNGSAEKAEIYDPCLDKYLVVSISPLITDEGVIAGAVHSLLDITEQKRAAADTPDDLIQIYSDSVNELKIKATNAQKGRDAFLNMLEDINESYNELEDLFMKLIVVMVNALDAKSPWTKGHSERVAMYAEQIAKEMFLDPEETKNIRLAGLLHDIGKIGTYDYLLDKPGKLTIEEFDVVKQHPVQGANILKDIKQLNYILPYIKYHHEKLDGKGYPERLSGPQIPLGARILHVADSFDSMTSDRPYRPAQGIEYALSEFEKYKGTQFDREVIEAFLKILKKSVSSEERKG